MKAAEVTRTAGGFAASVRDRSVVDSPSRPTGDSRSPQPGACGAACDAMVRVPRACGDVAKPQSQAPGNSKQTKSPALALAGDVCGNNLPFASRNASSHKLRQKQTTAQPARTSLVCPFPSRTSQPCQLPSCERRSERRSTAYSARSSIIWLFPAARAPSTGVFPQRSLA